MGVNKNAVKCEECTYSCKSKSSLYKHINAIHKELRIPCKKCDYEATQSYHLMQHFKSKHEGVRFFCNQCSFQATRKAYVKKHVKSAHEGVRYSCTKCIFTARTENSLRDHRKAVHEGIVYNCSVCPYKSAKKSNLKRHVETKHKTVKQEEDPNDKLELNQRNTETKFKKEIKEKSVRLMKKTTLVVPSSMDIKPGKGESHISKNAKHMKIEIGSSIEIKRKKNIQFNYLTLLDSYRSKNQGSLV